MRLRTQLLTSCLCLLCAAAGAAAPQANSPWAGAGLDLRVLEETLDPHRCSGADEEFVACISGVQGLLDGVGHHLHLLPASSLAELPGFRRVVARFGAALVVDNPNLRVNAEGNALGIIRKRTHRILAWSERVGPELRRDVDFAAIRDWLKAEVIEPGREAELVAAAVNGHLAARDAHARIVPAGTAAARPENRQGGNRGGRGGELVYSGIGAGVQPMVDAALVTSVVRDGPAAQAGLRVQDFILAIDGDNVSGLAAERLVERLRGPVGTRVALSVKRQDRVLTVDVARDAVTVRNVSAHGLIDRGWQLAYLRIDSFLSPTTCRDASRELARQLKPTLNGLILDLRDNSGGLIDQAACVADLFLPADQVVLEVRNLQDPESSEVVRTQRDARVQVPMVTLVNATTGSASEVLAGALQDHGRSLIVGERTFGKGTVQTLRPWKRSDSILEFFTTARYYRPSGVGVQLIGIEPDVEVRRGPEEDAVGAYVLREQDLFPTALPRETAIWRQPNPELTAALTACAEEGLAVHRLRRGETDHPLAVGQDALVCRLTVRLSPSES